MLYFSDNSKASLAVKSPCSNLFKSKVFVSLLKFSLSTNVPIHHSSHHPDSRRGWLFLKNSPNATNMSPKNNISLSFPLHSLASLIVLILTTSPFLSFTIGPSMESTGTTQLPFPGCSILSCVPTAKKSNKVIVAG